MKILIFCTEANVLKMTNLISSIEDRLLSSNLELCSNIPALRIKMTQLGQRPNVAVLFASNTEELNRLLEMKDLFSDVPVIVIIPDENQKSIHLGHKLYPRFLGTMNESLSAIPDILLKMKKNRQPF